MNHEQNPTPNSNIEWRDPASLHPHPLTKHLHTLPPDSDAFLRIVCSMERHGYDASEPIVIDERGRIMEGRHRWLAAKRLQLRAVACMVRPESEAASLIIRSLCARKHFNLGARAFEVYPLFEVAHREALARQTEFLKKGQFFPSRTECGTGLAVPKKVEDLAAEAGVSVRLFQQAAQVHDIFRADPEYAEQMLPLLFKEENGAEHQPNKSIGLWQIISGYGGKTATEGKARKVAEQLDLFSKAVNSFVHQAARMRADDESAKAAIRARLLEIEPEELERIAALADLVKTEARRALKAREENQ